MYNVGGNHSWALVSSVPQLRGTALDECGLWTEEGARGNTRNTRNLSNKVCEDGLDNLVSFILKVQMGERQTILVFWN